MNRKQAKRAQWCALFAAAVTEINPAFAGRIDWDAAMHHFFQGTSPGLAAVKFTQSESPEGLAFPSGATVKRS